MKCWSKHCHNKLEVKCPCTNPPTYSCDSHLLAHLKTPSKYKHLPESLTISPNPDTKRALITYLRQSLSSLYEYRRKTVHDFTMQIKRINDKMKVTLESFDQAIKAQQKIISQINLTEVISNLNKNEIDEILVLEPRESIKKLTDNFNIFDKSRFFIDHKGKWAKNEDSLNESDQFIVFRNNTMKIVKTDLKSDNFSSTEFNISLNNAKYMSVSMCIIPGNSVFCYGNHPPESTAFIIESNNNVTRLANAPFDSAYSGSIYYKNRVYIFGGYNGHEILTIAFYYDLKNKKWQNLKPLPAPSQLISCICRKNKILLSGFNHSKVYCYDITQNNYTELHNVQANYNKTVCGNKAKYYVIEGGGNIYESDNEWKVWITIGSSGIPNRDIIGYRVLYKDKVYFALRDYNFYEFDFKKKKIQMIKTI